MSRIVLKYSGETIEQIQALMKKGPVAIDGLPEEIYHSFPAMSNSGMREFMKAPGFYDYMRNNPSEDTPSRKLGRLVHLAIGEPERFASEVVAVEGSRNKKEVQHEIREHESRGKVVVHPEQFENAKMISVYCRAHSLIGPALEEGTAERSFFWIDEKTGAPCKARIDWITPSGMIIDWKHFDPNHDVNLVAKQIKKSCYDFQGFWYEEAYTVFYGEKPREFYNVFLKIDPPRRAQPAVMTPTTLETAAMIMRFQLERFVECLKEDKWPMDDENVMVIDIKRE